MPKTQTDYEQFATTFAATLGISHTLKFDSSAPCVDSQNIVHLPPLKGAQSTRQFDLTCATLVHELAHVYYRSNTEFARQAARHARLWQDCFNAVLDVADETGVERLPQVPNPQTKTLLLRSNIHYGDRPEIRSPQFALHWRILAYGIIRARIAGSKVRYSRGFGLRIARENPQVNILEVYRLLRAARLTRRVPGVHSRLILYAQKIADILASAYDDTAPVPVFSTNPLGDSANQEDDGTDIGIGSGGAGSSYAPSPILKYAPDTDTFRMFLPIVKQITQRIAVDGDSVQRQNSLSSGSSVAQPYRISTDGMCFGRYTVDDHADGMAVTICLDTSGSMDGVFSKVAGIASAFSSALRDCADVSLFTFDTRTREVQDFDKVDYLGGGTATDSALLAARTSLSRSHAGSKYIILITDGCSNSPTRTEEQTRLAVQDGISVLAVVLASSEYIAQAIRETMPGAHVSLATDTAHLAIELRAISSRL